MGKWWWCGRLCAYAETLFSEEDLRLTRLRALLQSIPHVQTCSPVESADPQGQEVEYMNTHLGPLLCFVAFSLPPPPFPRENSILYYRWGCNRKNKETNILFVPSQRYLAHRAF
jgi:hypothetical protein